MQINEHTKMEAYHKAGECDHRPVFSGLQFWIVQFHGIVSSSDDGFQEMAIRFRVLEKKGISYYEKSEGHLCFLESFQSSSRFTRGRRESQETVRKTWRTLSQQPFVSWIAHH